MQDITLVAMEAEKRPIADLIGATEYFNHDLVIVPITQIPDDKATSSGEAGDEEAAAAAVAVNEERNGKGRTYGHPRTSLHRRREEEEEEEEVGKPG